jgi:putative ABC transport system permease protein
MGRSGRITNIMISVLPREGVSRDAAMADVERIMRIRHGLKLDEENDFDLSTQDSFLKLWDRISSGTFFALVVISSIALMVGGIGVMAIMSISVTERTREIGVRKALGARRAEILFQFLMEAAFLTSLGGLIGIALGAGIGYAVHAASGLPDFTAVVVVRDRPRVLGVRRHLLRDVSRRSRHRASIRSRRSDTSRDMGAGGKSRSPL